MIGRCDMTQLFSHHWINSSNKTCNSVADAKDRKSILRKSVRKISQFSNLLRRGCRTIEADTWDRGNTFQREPVACQSLYAQMLRILSAAQSLLKHTRSSAMSRLHKCKRMLGG